MNKNSLGALVLLNLVLLAALLVVTFTPPQTAEAQVRGRGDYLMIAGSVTGRNDLKVVYIMEIKSLKLAAITVNTQNNKIDEVAGRQLAPDMEAVPGR